MITTEEPIVDTSTQDAESLGSAFDHYTYYGVIRIDGVRKLVCEPKNCNVESTFYVAVDRFGGFELPKAAKNLEFYHNTVEDKV